MHLSPGAQTGKICGRCDDAFEDANLRVQYVKKSGIDIPASRPGMSTRSCSDPTAHWVLRKGFGRRVKLRMHLCYGASGFR